MNAPLRIRLRNLFAVFALAALLASAQSRSFAVEPTRLEPTALEPTTVEPTAFEPEAKAK